MGRTPVCKRMIYFFLCSKDSEDTNRANNLFDFSFKNLGLRSPTFSDCHMNLA